MVPTGANPSGTIHTSLAILAVDAIAPEVQLIRIRGYLSFWGCVHIFNKQAVAHRLAVAARKTVYGETL
jgi:hypothetical protein